MEAERPASLSAVWFGLRFGRVSIVANYFREVL